MPFSRRLTRRRFFEISSLAASGLLLTGNDRESQSLRADSTKKPTVSLTPDQILGKLLDGNKRFVKGETTDPRRKPADFAKLEDGQSPMALIVGCADSRVAPELIFDQGVGDLFVVRVAGNVIGGAGAIVKGSIEYAIVELGVSLILVLGHSKCGAVKAALKHIDAKDSLPGQIDELVNLIKPAVAKSKGEKGDALENAIKANVGIGVKRLQELRPILAGPVKEGKVKVVGGIYDLRTGIVEVII
jgi:carbonic anhydrase